MRPDDVIAILAGRKTQMRIPFNQQPAASGTDLLNHISRSHIARFAPWAPGEVLWVRETWATTPEMHDAKPALIYKATENTWRDNPFVKWQSPATMPLENCRLFLQVTKARAQRIQEITVEDCYCEGIDATAVKSDLHVMEAMELQWNRENDSEYDWALNPWVWAYNIQVVHVGNAQESAHASR